MELSVTGRSLKGDGFLRQFRRNSGLDNITDTNLRCAAALQALQSITFREGISEDLQYGLTLIQETIEAALRFSAEHPDLGDPR